MKYSIYFPHWYDHDETKKGPFILFLHGAGEKGDDIKLLKSTGLPEVLEKIDIPFIVLSPQCPRNSSWSVDILDNLLNNAISKYRVDEDRIYVTGISMGGFATWSMALSFPERFAAIAPICGGGNTSKAIKIKHLPVWAYHGEDDKIVSPDNSKRMVDALKLCGGNVKFTLYPDTGHDCWTKTYNNQALFNWFLKHKKKSPLY